MTPKPISVFLLTFFVLLVASCNSSSEERAEAQTVQNESMGDTKAGNATYDTIENGFRLTENSLKSQVPEMLIGIPKNGEPSFKQLPGYSTVYQMYYDSENASAFYLDIFDYGDNQRHIREMQEGTVTGSSNTRQNESGWFVTEESRESGGKVVSRTLTIENPRFTIKLESNAGNAPEPSSFEMLMSSLEEANLLKLFDLEIPGAEEVSTQMADNRKDLACGEILPVEHVRSFCGIDGVEVNVTSFEQTKNCNRQYSHPDNFGGLTFIVTQYSNSETAVSAVQTKLNDDDLESEEIKNVGNTASLVTVDDNLFLSVAHNNYLVELRSSYGMGPAETASVCLDKEKLSTLANEVITKLP